MQYANQATVANDATTDVADPPPNPVGVPVKVSIVNGKHSCSPNPAIVTVSVPPVAPVPALLVWTFDPNTVGYVFEAENAIQLTPPLDGQFLHAPITAPGGSQVTLLDQATKTGLFTYTVTVKHVATGKRLRFDPTIKNQA